MQKYLIPPNAPPIFICINIAIDEMANHQVMMHDVCVCTPPFVAQARMLTAANGTQEL